MRKHSVQNWTENYIESWCGSVCNAKCEPKMIKFRESDIHGKNRIYRTLGRVLQCECCFWHESANCWTLRRLEWWYQTKKKRKEAQKQWCLLTKIEVRVNSPKYRWLYVCWGLVSIHYLSTVIQLDVLSNPYPTPAIHCAPRKVHPFDLGMVEGRRRCWWWGC